jgi:DNA-binding MarR family transcriptional regulator
MSLTPEERTALSWLVVQQGARPHFRLRFDRLEDQTGLSRMEAGMAIYSLRRGGFVEIETIAAPYRKHEARITDKGRALARTILPASITHSVGVLPAEPRLTEAESKYL